MKKSLLILTLSLCGLASAQEGSMLVQGNIGYTSETQKFQSQNIKVNEFNFDPKIGYQFSKDWTVGVESSIYSSKDEGFVGSYYSNVESDVNGFSIGAFARYTRPLSDLFSFYVDFGGGLVNTKRTDVITSDIIYPDAAFTTRTTTKGNGFYAAVTPAIFINLKNGFGLNFNIGGLQYVTAKYENNYPEVSSFDVNFGRAINIGVSKNFTFVAKQAKPQ